MQLLTINIHMKPTTLSKIQRQSIHECIVESHQQNSTISKDDYFEIGLSLLESIAGFESCSDDERFKTLETVYSDFNSTNQGD